MTASPLVLLKSGTAAAPLFITHGLGGRITEVTAIVAQLRTDRPVWGLQWQGLDGSAPPHATIEDMATCLADAITAQAPDGPCLLAGLSVGGVVMLEVARQLAARGRTVALVALLDAYPHPNRWPFACWAEIQLRRTGHHLAAIRRLAWRQAIAELRARAKSFWQKLAARRGAVTGWKDADDAVAPPALRRLRDCAYAAYATFRARPYAGHVVFIGADRPTVFPADPRRVWRDVIADMEVHSVPCEHTELSTRCAGDVAECLDRHLNVQEEVVLF
jgi:thioesterase domain-containing protein